MTAQVAEKLTYQDQTLAMCSEPLDGYLASCGRDIRFQGLSTACWRGYIGRWEVKGDRLYITGITATLENGNSATLKDLFPDFPNGAFAHWFTGEIRCPMGKQLKYVHMGYATQFEKDLFLTFKSGVLVAERIVKNGDSDRPDAPTQYGPGGWVSYPAKTKGPTEDSR